MTKQREIIRTKLELSACATKTLALYASAIMQANLLEPPRPTPAWRAVMDSVAATSCRYYRAVVRDEPNFAAYFRQARPGQVRTRAESNLSACYDSKLVNSELQAIAKNLRAKLQQDCFTGRTLIGADELLTGQAWVKESINLHKICTESLNIHQTALLQRKCEHEHPLVEQAILVTIADVAAGMRNTG